MGFHLYRSNRLEVLAEALAGLMRQPPPGPGSSVFLPEIVIVQSRGMERWLTHQIASRLGIAMQIDFPFPVRFAQTLLGIVRDPASNATESRQWHRDLMPWQILSLLPALLPRASFAALAQYVAGETRALKELQLAQQISVTFDRYIAYRPEMLMEWARSGASESAPWQAQIWHRLVAERGVPNLPELAVGLRDRIARAAIAPPVVAPRVSVFGLSQLPPLYLGLLGDLSRSIDVHWFQMEPTDLYWGEIKSLREQERIVRRAGGRSPEALHLETGHPLLASMGRLGRGFSRALLELEPMAEHDLFDAPVRRSLLGHLQANVFELNATSAEKVVIAPEDRSIQVHCCHSPMRELEVLCDQLLAMFEADRSLAPRDILVSAPDMERYAPYIEAVFGASEAGATAIPFSIADRTARAENCVTDSFLQILELAGSRFAAPTVLALLETRAIHKSFGLTESDLDRIRTWIERTAIRWGIDADHRATFGLPEFGENSWRAGLRRLLLGYALPGDGRTLFAETLPVPEIEGDFAQVLGSFVEFAEALFAANESLSHARPLEEWTKTLRDILHTFFDESEESAAEMRQLRATLDLFTTIQRDAGFDTPVALEVVRAHLVHAVEGLESGNGFLAGGVTFCALKPMRSIPFKVVCLIGMDDTAFPRHDSPPGFDRIAENPRPGDPSRRDDDRQIFLEALLSARETLYLSYCGLSPKDDSESPPSVVVSELLDHVRSEFVLADGSTLVDRHPLQAFSPRYFEGKREWFSYSAENFRACVRMRETRAAPPPFAATLLDPPEPVWREVDLAQLASFFANPARYFLRQRLGMRLPDEAAPLDEREPMTLEGLGRYQLEWDLARAELAGGEVLESTGLARSAGSLPAGWIGELAQRDMRKGLADFVASIRPALAMPKLRPLPVEWQLGDWRIVGTIHDIFSDAMVRHRPAIIRAKDLIRAWIPHVVLNAVAPAGYPRTTLLFGKESARRFEPMHNAETVLESLLALYAQGLRAPLRFFPNSSLAFMEKRVSSNRKERAPWRESEQAVLETADPHVALCFRGVEPFDEEWERLAEQIFQPLLDAMTDLDVSTDRAR